MGDGEYLPHIVEIFASDGTCVLLMAVPAGINEFKWYGKTVYGDMAFAGIYFIRVSSGGKKVVKRIIKL